MRDRTWKSSERAPWTLAGLTALLLLLLMALAAPAVAQDDDDDDESDDPFAGLYKKTGFYISGTGNYMVTTQKDDLESQADRRLDAIYGPGTSTDAENSWGFSTHLGYRAHERIAVDAQFEWLNTIELDSRINTGQKLQTDVSLFALTGNLRGYLISEGKVQPYVTAGAGWGQARTDVPGPGANERDDGVIYRFGAGIDLYGKPDIAVTAEASYVIPTGDIDDLSYFSIGAGLMVRFFPGGY